MSEQYVKISSNKNKGRKLTFAKAPIGSKPKKKGGHLVSSAFVTKGSSNPRPKLHVKRGDTVLVISGKDKGKTGKVIGAFPRKGKVIIEGVNIIKRHKKPTGMGRAGEIVEKEAPIFASKVMLFDDTKKKPTRISYKYLKNGKKVRISKVSGEQID